MNLERIVEKIDYFDITNIIVHLVYYKGTLIPKENMNYPLSKNATTTWRILCGVIDSLEYPRVDILENGQFYTSVLSTKTKENRFKDSVGAINVQDVEREMLDFAVKTIYRQEEERQRDEKLEKIKEDLLKEIKI